MALREPRATRILLKCRATPRQLADRLAPPVPEGLELYLDVADLEGADWLSRTVDLIASYSLPRDFAILVEGPLRSLDGSFFDLTRDTPANREVARRVAALGKALGAAAANVHAIAPVASAADFGEARRQAALRASLPLLRQYARICQDAGLRPLVENIPPVARMREGGYWYTPIGMAVEDLLWLAREVPGVGFTIDLSHAQLYLNARAAEPTPELAPLLRSLRERPGASSLESYVEAAAEDLVSVHVSNASGLLGEGLPFAEGDADLERVVGRLLGIADYLVTETLEPDPDHARLMRDTQARMLAIRARRAEDPTTLR